jgi:hypothetical protein
MLDLWVSRIAWRALRRRHWEGDSPESGATDEAKEPRGPAALD